MKICGVSTVFVLLLFVFAGSVFAQDEDFTVIELTEDQISIIVNNCPPVVIEELTLGREHLSRENTVELAPEGRAGVALVEAR